jgi:hypothetical protein
MTAYNRRTLIVGVAVAAVIAGVVSYFASSAPDGLEKFQEDQGAAAPAYPTVEAPPIAFQEYNFNGLGEGFWANAVAGVVGIGLVLGILLGVGRLLRRRCPVAPVGDDRAATRP